MEVAQITALLKQLSSAPIIEKRNLAESLIMMIPDDILPEMSAIIGGESVAGRGPAVTRNLVASALSTVCGVDPTELNRQLRSSGSLSEVATVLLGRPRQRTLSRPDQERLVVVPLFKELKALASGKISRKATLLRLERLLSRASPNEGKLIVQALIPSKEPYLPRTMLAHCLSKRLKVEERNLMSEVEQLGIHDAVAHLLGRPT